eukprot:7124869-Prymnesium_polylepis.1
MHTSSRPTVATPGPAHVVAFDVEPHDTCDYDHLIIDGARFCGTSGPDGAVPFDGRMEWTSDNIESRAGWEICFAVSPPEPPSPPGPPVPPPSPPPPPPPPLPPISVSGPCRLQIVDTFGTCIMSPGFPASYSC